MSINYVVTPKGDKSGEIPKVLYYATAEEVTADKVRVKRVCFRADKGLNDEVGKAKFMSVQLQEIRKEKQQIVPKEEKERLSE